MRAVVLLASALVAVVSPECLAANDAPGSDFYVAVDGSDKNPGSAAKPFATLKRARDAVRRRIASGLTFDVVVYLRGGVYALDETVVFGPEDSGTEAHSITYAAYPGEKPVLSGACRITEWSKGEGRLWSAVLPEVKAGRWYPRQLFVDGNRRQRARNPNEGFLRGMKSSDGKTLTLPPGQFREWTNPSDVELVTLVEWTPSRTRLHQMDPKAGTLAFPRQILQFFDVDWAAHILNNVAGFPYYFENAREMLDTAGEWYLDRGTGVLSYWPPDGEDPSRAVALMPSLQHLLRIAGTRERAVLNLRFRGITFIYTDFIPPDPFMPGQAGFGDAAPDAPRPAIPWRDAPAPAISMEYARGCRLEDGRLTHLGGTAVSLGPGCTGNTIAGNAISCIGANGVEVGTRDSHPADLRDVARDNIVANNHIHHCGLDYPGCVGVWVGLTEHTIVAHNLIHDLPYTGVSVGWNWSREKTPCQRNVVEYNHIHHVMQILADGGGIYVLGSQPGSQLRGNLVHDVAHYSGVAGNNGFFIDNGSNGWHIEGNVIYNAADGPVRHNDNQPEDHTWGTNSLGVKPGSPGFPKAAAEKAGLQPAYRKKLLGN